MAESLRAMQVQYVRDMAHERQSRFLLSGERLDFSASNEPRSGSGVLYTKQEDELMFELRCVQNVPWSVIRDYLPGRSMESLLNRWSYIRRRILPDLIAKGAIQAKNVRPVYQSTKDMLASKKLSLSSSYRADALRNSMLQQKGDIGTAWNPRDATGAESQKQPHPGPVSAEWQRKHSEQSVELQVGLHPAITEMTAAGSTHPGTRLFSISEDRCIKRLREQEKLLFRDIAKRLPGTNETMISDRYYYHILGRSLPSPDKPKPTLQPRPQAQPQPIQPRPYLAKTLRPVQLPDFTKREESRYPPKLRPLLPAPPTMQSTATTGPMVQSKEPPAPGTFILDERMLNLAQGQQSSQAAQLRCRRRLQPKPRMPVTPRTWQPFASSAMQKIHAQPILNQDEPSRTVSKHAAAIGTDKAPHTAVGTENVMPFRRPLSFPSSIPDTEDEDWQSSQPMLPAEVPPQSSHQSKSNHNSSHDVAIAVDPPTLVPQSLLLISQDHLRAENQEVQQDKEVVSDNPDTERAALSFDDGWESSQLELGHVRYSTPLQHTHDLPMPASSPPLPDAAYGTPARWNQHSMPYFVQETSASAEIVPIQPCTVVAQIDAKDPRVDMDGNNPLSALPALKVAAHRAQRKRKSDGFVDLEASDRHIGKKHRCSTQSTTLRRQRRIVDSEDEEADSDSTTTSRQAAGEVERFPPQSTISVSSRSSEPITTSSRTADIAPVEDTASHLRSSEDGCGITGHTRWQSRSSDGARGTSDGVQSIVAKVRPPACASRTITRPKGRVSDLMKQARGSVRKLSNPSSTASQSQAKRASDVAIRRMSSLVDQLSDDELA